MLREEVLKMWKNLSQRLKKEREFIEFLSDKFSVHFGVFSSNSAKVEDKLEN
jgi:hypothetical protein